MQSGFLKMKPSMKRSDHARHEQRLPLNSDVTRVPAVYLTWANPMFLAFFAFSRINNLRVFNVAFSPIPTAPTNVPATT